MSNPLRRQLVIRGIPYWFLIHFLFKCHPTCFWVRGSFEGQWQFAICDAFIENLEKSRKYIEICVFCIIVRFLPLTGTGGRFSMKNETRGVKYYYQTRHWGGSKTTIRLATRGVKFYYQTRHWGGQKLLSDLSLIHI